MRTSPSDTVLIVDDEPLVLSQLAKFISAFTPVRTAASCKQATEWIADDSSRLLAVVTDLHLPDGSAWDVLARARERYPRIPAMVLTGRSDPSVPSKALVFGAAFLEKPFEFAALRKFVVDALAHARGREADVERVLNELTERCKLTPTERAIMEARILGLPKHRLRDGRDLHADAAHTHHASIREKTGLGIPKLTEQLLREIFGVDY
jgi:FixJ family two-component response regulator